MNSSYSSLSSMAKHAEELRDAGDPRAAIALLNAETSQVSDALSVRFIRAKCFADLRRFADALAELELVLQTAPDHLKARKLRAEIYLLLNQHQAALRELTDLVERFPQDMEAVVAMEKLEDFLFGAAASRGVLASASSDRLRSFQESHSGLMSQVSVEREEIITSDDSEPAFATKTIAELYIRQGHNAKAIKVLKKMVLENPSDSWAIAALNKLEGETKLPLSHNSAKTTAALKARKIHTLERLLARVQRHRGPKVIERLENTHAI